MSFYQVFSTPSEYLNFKNKILKRIDGICLPFTGLPTVTLDSNGTASAGSSYTITCYVTSNQSTVTSVSWHYQKNGVTSVINTTDTAKYSGGTVESPSLTINNLQSSDVGNYRCLAQNAAGIGQSQPMAYLDLSRGFHI